MRSDNSVKSKDSEPSHEGDRETKRGRDTHRGRGLVRDKKTIRSKGKVKDSEIVTNKETAEDGDDEAEEDFKPFSEISNSKSGTNVLLGCNATYTLSVIFMILEYLRKYLGEKNPLDFPGKPIWLGLFTFIICFISQRVHALHKILSLLRYSEIFRSHCSLKVHMIV